MQPKRNFSSALAWMIEDWFLYNKKNDFSSWYHIEHLDYTLKYSSNSLKLFSNFFFSFFSHYQCSIQAQCSTQTPNLTHSLFKSWSSSHTLLLQINLICIPIKSARLKSYIVWFACEQQIFKYALHMLFPKTYALSSDALNCLDFYLWIWS